MARFKRITRRLLGGKKKVMFEEPFKLGRVQGDPVKAGKLDTVWVRAKRVPKTLKNYHGICEVGSTLGQVIEVDMETFRKDGSIRFLVGVVNYKNIPAMAKLTTKKLMIYYIYFQVEQVVEEGWLRPEEEYIQEFDVMEDTLSQELGDRREKRQRTEESEGTDKGGHIQASEQTKKALEEREEEIKRQNELDAIALAKKKGIVSLQETNQMQGRKEMMGPTDKAMEKEGDNLIEETGDNVKETDQEMEYQTEDLETIGRVDLSGDEGDKNVESESSLSMTTKINNVHDGKSPNHGKKKHKGVGILEEIEEANGNRFSNRLAPKSDVPIMDRAKNRAMVRNLQSSEGSTSLPTLANTSDYSILDIASKVGIDLGTTLDMIDTNLALIREKEQARVNIFLSKEEDPEILEYPIDMDRQPDVVDQVLMDILKMGKGDCEVLTDNLITSYISEEKQNVGGRVTPLELHCKTPIKSKVKCRKGKRKESK
ncbi:hypothetical protein ACQ4PT_072062 [Festuca glaucescens]